MIYASAKVKTEPFECDFGPPGDREGTSGTEEDKRQQIDDLFGSIRTITLL